MKPVAFDVVRPRSIAEVIDLLSQSAGGARIVAGSQSLGPMLNLRLVRPEMLIDITGIPEMTSIDEDEEGVTIGACVTTGSIEDGKLPREGLTMLPVIAADIAYRAVRNRGTIGGSVFMPTRPQIGPRHYVDLARPALSKARMDAEPYRSVSLL